MNVANQNIETDLSKFINEGEMLLEKEINTKNDFEDISFEKQSWADFVFEYLKGKFKENSIAEDFQNSGLITTIRMHGGLAEDISDFRKLLKSQINNIKSLKRRLPLLIGPDTKSHNTDTPFNKNIFLVHGHKDNFKLEVARTLEQLKLNPIILDEKPNEGQTIIEKFEKHASISSLAVVLLTADDEIKTSSKSEIKWRARQNVILELGYFLAKLGRQRVIALYEENVEIPSDYSGVLYIPFRSDWKLKLAGEIKNLGLEIDLNLLHNLQ